MEEHRKRRRKKKPFLLACGCLMVLALAVYLGLTLFHWSSHNTRENGLVEEAFQVQGEKLDQGSVNDVTEEKHQTETEAMDQQPLYNEVQVEQMLAQARQEAGIAAREEIIGEIQMQMEEGKTIVEAMRACFTERLVLASSGRYFFIPIRQDLKHNSYVNDNLRVLENGELQYWEEEKVVSYKGIDVSKFQGEIDWDKVAADHVDFAMIRVGNRGYGGNGTLVEDSTFEQNMEAAKAAGIKVGVYFYSQALDEEELLEEAQFVLDKIAPYDVKGPVVYDVEKVNGAAGRMNFLTVEERTNLTKLFCETVEKAGYRPMIYHNLEMGLLMLDLKQLEQYDKWFAYYKNELYYPYDYSIWQYTEKGKVDGIKGEVDLNIAFSLWDE